MAGLPVPHSQANRTSRASGRTHRLPSGPETGGRKPRPGVQLDPQCRPGKRTFEAAKGSRRAIAGSSSSFTRGRTTASWWSVTHMVAVAERVPAHVIGDGEHTIAELVDIVNADPRRGVGQMRRCSPGSRSLLLLRNRGRTGLRDG